MSKKNPLTPAGIEPATFRFVAQHLNYCANAVPQFCIIMSENDTNRKQQHQEEVAQVVVVVVVVVVAIEVVVVVVVVVVY